MDFLSWNDFIQPTNPLAAVFFGVVFTVIVTAAAWFETKETKTAVVVFSVGIGVVVIGVTLLWMFGYYN